MPDGCKRRTDNHPVLDLPSIDGTQLFLNHLAVSRYHSIARTCRRSPRSRCRRSPARCCGRSRKHNGTGGFRRTRCISRRFSGSAREPGAGPPPVWPARTVPRTLRASELHLAFFDRGEKAVRPILGHNPNEWPKPAPLTGLRSRARRHPVRAGGFSQFRREPVPSRRDRGGRCL